METLYTYLLVLIFFIVLTMLIILFARSNLALSPLPPVDASLSTTPAPFPQEKDEYL